MWCYLRPNNLNFGECYVQTMSNHYKSGHTTVGWWGFPLKGMDVPTVSHRGERSVMGQEMRALTKDPKNEVGGKFPSLSLHLGVGLLSSCPELLWLKPWAIPGHCGCRPRKGSNHPWHSNIPKSTVRFFWQLPFGSYWVTFHEVTWIRKTCVPVPDSHLASDSPSGVSPAAWGRDLWKILRGNGDSNNNQLEPPSRSTSSQAWMWHKVHLGTH